MKRVSPEKVVEMLKERDVNITLEQAKIILEFLYVFCNFSVKQTLGK